MREEGIDPPSLHNRPEIDPILLDYWEAFHILSCGRPMGWGGVGYIPLEEMRAYMEIFKIDHMDERRLLVYYLRIMDQIFVEHYASKPAGDSSIPKKSKTPTMTAGRRRRHG